MINSLHRLVHAALILPFLTLAGLTQQTDQNSTPAGSQQTAPAVPHQPSNEPQMPASGEITVKDAKTFSGNIVKENGELVLKDPVTKVSYKLSDSGKAHRYKGKRVKVTGKLDANSNTIQVEKIEPIS